MKRELELERRLRSLRKLAEAVRAMKGLSAHHYREARQAVSTARNYREGVERILAWANASLAGGGGEAGLLIIGGELGLCGSYNSQIVGFAAEQRRQLGPGPTFCVGHRASALLGRHGVDVQASYEGPTSVRGISSLLSSLAEDLLTRYAIEGLASIDIVASEFRGVGSFTPQRVRLLPFASEPSRLSRSAHYVDRPRFASVAAREFLFITLYDLLLDALACEHAARLLATQAAESWLDERIEGLRRHLTAARREATTQEMLEIAAGAPNRRAMLE